MATKFLLLVVCLAVYASTTVSSSPTRNIEDVESDNVYIVTEERADRHRRVTCDLLSFGGTVNHSACAAHCIARGKTGGRCQDGVCVCRKTNIFG